MCPPNTPAEKAGIKSGDVIVAVQWQGSRRCPQPSIDSFRMCAGNRGHGKNNSKRRAKKPSPSNWPSYRVRPGKMTMIKTVARATSNTDALDGVTVSDLDQQSRQELKIPDAVHGVLVTDVRPDSNSAEAGLKQGDVIVEINRQPVGNTDDAVKLCKQAKGDQILLRVWHRSDYLSGTRYLAVDNTRKDSKQK